METQQNLYQSDILTEIMEGDCREVLPTLLSESIDLIVTSPPYANARRKQYGGIAHADYVDWFLPIASELYRVLKPSGTFILNIKENVVNGERSTYVMELILSLRKLGFLFTEEYCWCKKNSMPGKWKNRFRDAWERLLQFNKSREFAMYQDAVMVRRKDSTAHRLTKLSANSTQRVVSSTGSNFSKRLSAWVGREYVYPSNVLYLSVESKNRKHSAVFPESLPEWFIKLFTVAGDMVLDPFSGSGTTGAVCCRLNRNFIGIEKMHEYVELSRERISVTKNIC
ncbi:MAG: site-specific DNA-methyltransferase [Planctomycetaceae bacterium]|jgi:DNA modification methylase|nr:site-specific DNA-methyltransferase [Planctomycetaceae bacterium]